MNHLLQLHLRFLVAALLIGVLPHAMADDTAKTFIVSNGAFPWFDRVGNWQLANVPPSVDGNGPLPQQSCGARNVVVPDGAKSIVIAVSDQDVESFKVKTPDAQATGDVIAVAHADGSGAIPYTIFKLVNPPAIVDGTGFAAGLMLLQVGDRAPGTAPTAVPSTNAASATPPPPPKPPAFVPVLTHFDTGDKTKLHIFLLIGQSNMVGRDIRGIESQTTDPRIGFLRGKVWYVAIEPIHQGGSGFGPGIPFARELLKEYPDGKIGLVPCAVGGSPLKDWVKGAHHYEDTLKAAKIAAESGVIEGVLWHQGESDSTKPEDATTYEARLTQMFTDLRTDLGQPNLPIVVGQLGNFFHPPQIEVVKAALAKMPQDLPHVGFADSDGLTDRGDKLHFSADSQREFGLRYAAAMEKLLALPPAPATSPTTP